MDKENHSVPAGTPFQFLFSQPGSVSEGLARMGLVSGRLLGYAWKNQRIIEQYTTVAQTGMLTLWEELWQNSLEAMYLREPKRSEKIDLS